MCGTGKLSSYLLHCQSIFKDMNLVGDGAVDLPLLVVPQNYQILYPVTFNFQLYHDEDM